jgi:dTMP kinase
MQKHSGKFITIEGCEGVGKSTQAKMLADYCLQRGIDAVFTREPGGTLTAEKIRDVILDPLNTSLDPYAELLLYSAARRQHTEELIKPALTSGKIVFCDRYTDSTMAYQGYARGLDKTVIALLNRIAASGVDIDLTIFLDVAPDAGFSRKGGADKSDRIEGESIEFHRRVYDGYKAIALGDPDRFVSFTAQGTKFETSAMIIDALKKRGIF